MQGRPLCAASAIFVGILFLWYILSESPIESGRWEGQIHVSCQVEQIQGIGEKQSLVVCDVIQDGQTYCQRMKVYGPAGQSIFRDIKIGHIISIAGTASSFSIPGNPGQFNEYKYYTEQGIQCKCFAKTLTIEENTVNARAQWLYELRTAWYGLLSSCLPEKEAGIVAAMLLGEKSGLTEEVKELYQRNGIAHILAISGVKMLSLVSPYPLKKPVNWAFMRLHIAESYIISEGFSRRISSHCPSWDRGDKSLENNLAKVSIISQKLYCSAKEK